MVRVTPSVRFKKARLKAPNDVRSRADEALRKFIENPRHPSLHFEKLKGSDYRTIRVDQGRWRIVLRGEHGDFELVDLDRHEVVDQKYG